MIRKPPLGLFITGNNTEVGKTYVASLIARQIAAAGIRLGVYKPAASGCRLEEGGLVAEDAVQLWEAAGRPGTLDEVCPQKFAAPLAPHLAARAERKELDTELLRRGAEVWIDRCDLLLVEGAGGLMSPMADEEYVADLANDFGYPLIVVAANRLGVINETLQTLITASVFRNGLEIAGVILNDIAPQPDDISRASNFDQLQQRCVPPMLAHVPYAASELPGQIDWLALARGA
ncbi:dethiobiotin synthase [Blastopirellula sp. JC732]|uniref:ATP-dependent dethiobiotin synthetase BioD n=1 Tax=Blastopirellula sediminis TaxID=2894196 RepID=A0A9X1MMA2_9BACT|nr:dethiobiotin synthase [Blastopirellula sediminis]MCC9606987.1 dethiobiotin synthase [Blastopirellula sediminis]MCC9629718.1 dethiobiotin synthase [Blastopirellula sediminis]